MRNSWFCFWGTILSFLIVLVLILMGVLPWWAAFVALALSGDDFPVIVRRRLGLRYRRVLSWLLDSSPWLSWRQR